MADILSPHLAIPLLAEEWKVDQAGTANKIHQFIRYYTKNNMPIAKSMYEAALEQLQAGKGVEVLGSLSRVVP